MIHIDQAAYTGVAQLLATRIADTAYFNGSVEYDTEEFCSRLTCTLIIYRRGDALHDIVPVWWDFELHQATGQQPTDFSWGELKEFLLELL